jgi:hypothetical protein
MGQGAGSMVVTRRFQARGQLDSTCTQPHRTCRASPAPPPCRSSGACTRAACAARADTRRRDVAVQVECESKPLNQDITRAITL